MARGGKERQALRAHFSPLGLMECGCDEAGRGCLAGPVVAAAVILPERFAHPLLNDSKQLSESQRELLRPLIEAEALSWGIGVCSPEEIDQLNILQASITAMHRAIDQLVLSPELLLIDGNRFRPYPGIPHECIVKGDATYRSIAAASILAKTERDRMMLELAQQYPGYGVAEHKGYPTPQHRAALAELGTSPVHRLSFRLL